MGNPIDSSQFVRLLDDRLREVAEMKYQDLPTMIPMLFRVMNSDSAWEEFYEVGNVPDIPEFNGQLSYLGIAPGYHTKIEHKEYAAALQHERKLIDDKRYMVLDRRAEGLMMSAHRVREKLAADNFNNAFSTAFTFMEREENVALCSNSHTTKSGTSTSSGFDNLATTALSKSQVSTIRLAMRLFRNDISERINIGDDLALVVPDALVDTAMEIVGSPKGLYTAEHTTNVSYQRYDVIPYLRLDDTDTNNWFMVWKSQMMKDNLFIDRIMAEVKTEKDFETYMLKTAVYMRCSRGFTDWRWIYGSQVS